ncbi:MAG: hypothetical protein EOP86_24475, partial [Verrucomicrobiaceae bacterium]
LRPVLLAGLFTAAAMVPLHARILAYEGFDYIPDAPLVGLAGGQGWAAPWTVVSAAGGSLNVVGGSLLAGTNAPAGYDAKSTGQSVNLISNHRAGRLLDTSATGSFSQAGYVDGSGRIGADGKTLYLSFLQQADGTSLFYEFEFHRGDLGDPGRIAGIGNDQGGDDVNLRAPAGTHTPIGAGNTDVNFYVVRIDFQPDNDDIRVWQNPVSATEPGEATLTLTGQADMSFDGISFGAFLNARQVAHDELRIGESWQDVMSAVVNPPTVPQITGQPQGAFSYTGGTVRLTAAVTGNPAPALRWFHNDIEIPGKTDPELILTNVQTADGGNYKLTATNSSGTVTSAVAAVTVQTKPAGLIAYEGFDYAAGTANLPGQNGGVGWAEPWQQISGAGQSVTDGSLTAGVHAPAGYDSQSHGNQVNLPNGQRDGRFLDTTPEGVFGALGYVDDFGNIGADGKTLYLSFLQQPNGTSSFYEMEFHRGDLGDPGRIGGVGNDQGGSNVNLRAPNEVHSLIGPGSTDVNFYVVRID